jgi:hypothetical protein
MGHRIRQARWHIGLAIFVVAPSDDGGVRLRAPGLRGGCEQERRQQQRGSPPGGEDARVYRAWVLEAFGFVFAIHTVPSFPKGQHSRNNSNAPLAVGHQ